ncbi:receptor-like protein kinase precursor [Seminavis robusta]|uniref:Receptor-like protein kinase n=1 Tax=Seminavis robusta TaxID=568900 RepID=A0A9N8HMG2_9STRA|nr:receptor-like protein kinase precursor [Seminavis robusta]|eukprot:Sro1114_g242810.1 receptor-like protein kinase precursor (703) ;mRNA; f:25983-28091
MSEQNGRNEGNEEQHGKNTDESDENNEIHPSPQDETGRSCAHLAFFAEPKNEEPSANNAPATAVSASSRNSPLQEEDQVISGDAALESITHLPQPQQQEDVMPGAFLYTNGTWTTAHERNAVLTVDQPLSDAAEEPQPENLAMANPVQELPRAEPFQTSQRSSQVARKRDFAIVGCVLIAFTLMVGALVLYVVLNPTTASSTVQPTQHKLSRANYLFSLLPNDTVATIDQRPLDNTLSPVLLSPQTRAFNWTIHDPNFETREPWQLVENFALVCFYYATAGDTSWNDTTNWLSYNREEFPWLLHKDIVGNFLIAKSVIVALFGGGESEELDFLWLQDNGLKGSLPPEFFLLTSLKSIYLDQNPLLHGTLPTQIGNLGQLQLLQPGNSFSGSVPTEIGRLSSLLAFQINDLEGQIPSEIGALDEMVFLDLSTSNFMGPIPSELGNLSPWILWLDVSQLQSTIPTELGQLSTVLSLGLRSNMLTGTVPTELGNLLQDPILYKEQYLVRFEEKNLPYDAELILDVIMEMLFRNVSVLALADNMLTGSVPSEFGQFSEVSGIDLGYNSFSGFIPSELGLLSNTLEWLALRHNHLDGSVPSELGLLSKGNLFLNHNSLTGSVPSELGLLTNAKYLILNHNELKSSLPTSLVSLVNDGSLLGLNINSTGITGTVPTGLCSLGPWNHSFLQGLSFDCSRDLCGCAWCPC